MMAEYSVYMKNFGAYLSEPEIVCDFYQYGSAVVNVEKVLPFNWVLYPVVC